MDVNSAPRLCEIWVGRAIGGTHKCFRMGCAYKWLTLFRVGESDRFYPALFSLASGPSSGAHLTASADPEVADEESEREQ